VGARSRVERVHDDGERPGLLERVGLTAAHRRACGTGVIDQRLYGAGLADTRLTLDQQGGGPSGAQMVQGGAG